MVNEIKLLNNKVLLNTLGTSINELIYEEATVVVGDMIVKLDSADTTLGLDTSGGFDVTDISTNTVVYDTSASGTQTATGLVGGGNYAITLKGTTASDYFKIKSNTITECNLINIHDIITLYYSFYQLNKMTTFTCDADLRYVTSFDSTFRYCTSLTSIPTGLFDYNIVITEFYATFGNCTSVTSIPSGLFDYNTAVISFSDAFRDTGITAIPPDLFRYNTAVTSFVVTFLSCTSLTSIPTELFKYNPAADDFYLTFYGCTKLQLNRNIFYADGEQTTRFLNKSISFRQCFHRTSFSGVQGEAPDLWNCDFGTGTPNKTGCFDGAGNSLTSISNYNDIPVDWI